MLTSRLILASVFVTVPVLAAPSGRIGFVGAKGAQILHLPAGTVTSLPHASKATYLTVSPQGTSIYFVSLAGAKANDDGMVTVGNGFQSSPPYKVAKPMLALQKQSPYSSLWNRSGKVLYLYTSKFSGTFTPATGQAASLKNRPASIDQNERHVAYSTESEIVVRDTRSGQSRVVFDLRHPEPMLDALKAAKSPKNVSELLPSSDDPLFKEERNWYLSDPALAPDGSRLYFASNAGTGTGASGNSSFALFAVDLKTNKLAVLSKVGTNFGRAPHIVVVSPDGRRLMFASSVHASAADNSCFVEIVDLLTQNSREVFTRMLPDSKDKANFLDSAAWSPDSKYVALSGYFYNADKLMQEGHKWTDPKPAQYTMGIVDAGTGRVVKTMPGATSLNWIR